MCVLSIASSPSVAATARNNELCDRIAEWPAAARACTKLLYTAMSVEDASRFVDDTNNNRN